MALENMIEATVLLPSVNLRKCAGKVSCAYQVITSEFRRKPGVWENPVPALTKS